MPLCYTLIPRLSNTPLPYNFPNPSLGDRDYIYPIFDKIDRPNKQKLHNFHKTALADYNSPRTLPAPEPHPPTPYRMCHLRREDLQPQGLIKFQIQDRHRYFEGLAPNTPWRAVVPHTLLAAIPNPHFTNRYAQVILSVPSIMLVWPPPRPLPGYLVRWRHAPTRWLSTPH